MGNAGRSAASALAQHDSSPVIACDDRIGDEVRLASRNLAERGVEFTDDPMGALDRVCAVVKSPGFKLSHEVIEAARARGLPVLDEFELGWRLSWQPVVAITGTDGKSTTCALVTAALDAAGGNPLLSGNVEGFRGAPAMSAVPPEHDGWVVAEVSSYQAAGCPEFLPAAALLTNLTSAHLGWHGSQEAYAEAKRRLFVRGDRSVSLGVVSADDDYGRRLAREVRDRGGRALTFGFAGDADYRIRSCNSSLRGGEVEIESPDEDIQIETRLPGAHNAANVAAALALSDGLGLSRERTLEALGDTPGVPGRFDPVDEGQPFDVVVDFAHTPAAVDQTLQLARELVSRRGGRAIVVMGKVGPGTRPYQEAIGWACAEGADHLIICGSSLRGEPQLTEIPGVLAGAREAEGDEIEVVLDRRKAISRAVCLAEPGDLVAILGRGGRRRMMYDTKGPTGVFDDREVARELLAELVAAGAPKAPVPGLR
ncbi:MAG TPA: Mur ligase family protein [Solirubrobacterales bacterium]|nr:Mur ligase family protein [Solirubrobacterales bacterium]